jgi:cytosine/uracil/thiamine/allantoin permease
MRKQETKLTFLPPRTVTTRDMTSYFIFWLIQLPFFFVSPNKLRYVFALKTLVVPILALAMMGTLVHSAGGGGPLFAQGNTVHGKELAMAWLTGFAALQVRLSFSFSSFPSTPSEIDTSGLSPSE